MTSTFAAIVVLVLTSIRPGFCFPGGAPFKSCVNGFPKHEGVDQQMSPSPYIIQSNQSTYRPLDHIQVTLKSPDGKPFRGFQVGARLASSSASTSFGEDNDVILGEWIGFDEMTTILQYWYPDQRGTHNCATHKTGEDKSEVVLTWKAPRENVGDIVFRSGFVQEYTTFWADVESPVIRSEVKVTGKSTSRPAPPPDVDFRAVDCGRTKGCFLYPPDCTDADCVFGVSYQRLPDGRIRFQMIGRSEEYISLALSEDELMGSDETMSCISSESKNVIQHGYNPSQHNDHHRNFDLSEKLVARKDGRIFCSFVRPLRVSLTYMHQNRDEDGNFEPTVTEDEVITFDLSQGLFIQVARGAVYKGSTVMKKHIAVPVVSPMAVDLLNIEVVYGVGLPAYLKAHAILGYFAWFFLSGIAMIVARHYRQILNRKISGSAVWFQLHRWFMFLVATLTSILIIVIFASVGEWTRSATNHAIVGLTTTGLAVIQIVFGMLRPGLESPRRPIFNYFHRSVAISAEILAVTTLILGSQVDLLPHDLGYTLTAIIAVSVGVLLVLEIILECLRLCCSGQVVQTPLVANNKLEVETEPAKADRKTVLDTVRQVLFVLFIIVALTSFVTFAVYIAVV